MLNIFQEKLLLNEWAAKKEQYTDSLCNGVLN